MGFKLLNFCNYSGSLSRFYSLSLWERAGVRASGLCIEL
jgi:hypothetical protein